MTVECRRKEQLGMPFGTAAARLRKEILFDLVKKCGDDICFRCGKQILTSKELSIEHKHSWENVNPELFWDLNNIAFSHLQCNVGHGKRHKGPRVSKPEYRKCPSCEEEYPSSCYHKDASFARKISVYCIPCNHLRKGRKFNKTYLRLTEKLVTLMEDDLSNYNIAA